MELLIYWKWLTADSSYGSLPGQCIHIPPSLGWVSQLSPMRNSSHHVSPVSPGTELHGFLVCPDFNGTNTAAVRERMELAWADLHICVKFQTQNWSPGLICLHLKLAWECGPVKTMAPLWNITSTVFLPSPARSIRPSLSMRAQWFCLLYSI